MTRLGFFVRRWIKNNAVNVKYVKYLDGNDVPYNIKSNKGMCTHCGSKNFTRHGFKIVKTGKKRRYKCKDCGRDFVLVSTITNIPATWVVDLSMLNEHDFERMYCDYVSLIKLQNECRHSPRVLPSYTGFRRTLSHYFNAHHYRKHTKEFYRAKQCRRLNAGILSNKKVGDIG